MEDGSLLSNAVVKWPAHTGDTRRIRAAVSTWVASRREDLSRHQRHGMHCDTRGICTDLFRYVLTEHELLTGEVNLQELGVCTGRSVPRITRTDCQGRGEAPRQPHRSKTHGPLTTSHSCPRLTDG